MNVRPDVRVAVASFRGGGTQHVCLRLCNHWASQGVKVELLVVRAEGPYRDRLDPRIVLVDANARRILTGLWRLAVHCQRYPRVPLLVFGFDFALGLAALKMIGLLRCTMVFREGSCPSRNVPRHLRRAYRLVLATVEVVVAQSRTICDELVALGIPHSKIVIISNPCPAGVPELARSAAYSERDNLLAVGRLSPEKGFARLLRGFAAVQRGKPELTICGEGPERQRLEMLATELGLRDRVEFKGFVRDLSPVFRGSHLFILSSHFEGQPNALIEALLHGCRTLCASCPGGVVDLMEDCGLADCLVSDECFETSLPHAIEYVMNLPEERWVEARVRIRELTEPGKIATKYLSLLKICATR